MVNYTREVPKEGITFPFSEPTPTINQATVICDVNYHAAVLYETIMLRVPETPERTLAIRSLQEAVFWARKSVLLEG